MRILLVGEYSRLHNSLKEGLMILGHEVLLVSTGDFFKKYPSDVLLKQKYHTGFLKYVKVGIFKLLKVDITSRSVKNQFFKNAHQFQGFDVVQLINENPFAIQPDDTKVIVQYLKEYNKKIFLLCCGTDYISVSHALSEAHPYSILSLYKDKSVPEKHFRYVLQNIAPKYKKLHEFIYERIEGVIASDMDYHLTLLNHPAYLGLVPNPVNISKIEIPEVTSLNPIVIFMGINRSNYHTKGIVYFEEALERIEQDYVDKVSIQIVENLPYKEYIKKYNKAHILLDQVLAYDQGYNALEAMAKGKVVFTGAEQEWCDYYGLEKDTVAINALPDATYIAEQLANLIENPERIKTIQENAKAFVKEYHDHIKVASQYIEVWKRI